MRKREMPASAARKNVHLDCGKYFLRTVTVDDASDRWGSWMADPEASFMLNAPPRTMTKGEIEAYIRTFDQSSHLLWGIFEKASAKLLGFFRMDIDDTHGRFLVSMLIGEPDYRNKGVTQAVTPAFRDYFFETLGLKTMLATALSHNHAIIHYLVKTGWTLDKTIPRHVRSHVDGTMLDLCYFSHTREAWRAWKQTHLAGDAAQGANGKKR
jgi:RimJ/RimL family protein N-acetyltransferase